MIRNWLFALAGMVFFNALLAAQSREDLVRAVNTLPGWTAVESASYGESNLDKLDPAIAASLRVYGVEGVTVQNWQTPSGHLRVTLYQMVHRNAAYGFFTLRRKTEGRNSAETSYGAAGFQAGTGQYFWQSRYVVKLEGAARAVENAAMKLSATIAGPSLRPAVINHLPSTNFIPDSDEYILEASALPRIGGLDVSDLGFDYSSAEAASADYQVQGKTVHLLLVLYPTQQLTKKYADKIAASNPAISQKRIGPLLAIASGATDTALSQSVLEQVHYESKVSWTEPQPGLGLGPLIVTIFTFIGILLGACLIAGFGFGGIRIWMKRRYPDRAFDRASGMEIIQLKLDQQLTRSELQD